MPSRTVIVERIKKHRVGAVIAALLTLLIILLFINACDNDDVSVVEQTVTETVTEEVTVPVPTTTSPTTTAPVAPSPPQPPAPPQPPTYYPQLDGQMTPVGREGSVAQLRNLGALLPSAAEWRTNPYGQTFVRVGNEPLFALSLAESLGTATSFTRSGLQGLINEDGSWNELGVRFVTALQNNLRSRWHGAAPRLPAGKVAVFMATGEREDTLEIHSSRSLRVSGPLAAFRSACGMAWVDRRGNIYWQCQTVEIRTKTVYRTRPAHTASPPAASPTVPAPRPVAPAPRPVTPDKWAPTVRFSSSVHEMYVNGVRRFCAVGTDRDGDKLTYNFSASTGLFSNANNNCADYTAPGSAGTYTVTVTVSDGTYSRSASQPVRVLADDFGQP